MKKVLTILLALVLVASLSAAFAEGDHFVIGMSQCNLGEPWRVAMNDQIAAEAANYPEFEVIYADAGWPDRAAAFENTLHITGERGCV